MAGTVYLSEGFSAADLPDGRLVAIDLKSGERRWRFDPRGTSSRVRVALPHVAAAGQVYVARYGALYALDAAGGGLRWSYRPETAGPQTKPVVLGDTVYCLVRTPSARAGSVNGLRLVALDAATGSVRWSGSTEETKAGPDDRVDLAAAGGLISVIDGDLYVFDAVGRRLQRRHRLNGAGAAAVAGGTVFAVDEDGLRAIRAGKVQWAFTASRWITGAPFALHGDTVYLSTGVGDTSALHAIDAATGKTRWRFAADDTRAGALTASGGVVYVTQSTSLYALDAATGQVRWRYRGEAQIGDDLVAANGTVYVQEGARTILALRAPRPAAAPTG
jgi:outer membrane protein assembly factor BamB